MLLQPVLHRLCLFLALALAPGVVLGQSVQEDPFEGVETIVITPSSPAEDTLLVPYAGAVVSRRDLAERPPRTTPQAFRYIPGVMVQETAQGQGSPYIRGFTGQQNVMLIDGVRLNNSVFRSGPNQYWNTVDAYSIDRFELLKGPGSVLAGSDALGGTVSAFTRRPESAGPGSPVSGEFTGRYSTAEESTIGRIESSVTPSDQWGVLIGLTGKSFGDVHGGSDISLQPNTGYDEWAGDIKLEHTPDADTRFTLLHQSVHQRDVPRTHRTIDSVSFAGTTTGSELRRDLDQDRTLTYLQYQRENIGTDIDLFSAGVSWHYQAEERDRLRTGGRHDVQGLDVGTLGLFARAATPATTAGTFSFGVDAYHDNVNSFRTNLTSPDPADEIQGPVADDASYDLLGVYLQDELEVNERLDLTLGARFQYAHADADSVRDPVTDMRTSIDDSWDTVVGSARFAYALAEDRWSLFGGVSQGFRAPNISDLTRFDSARTDEFEVPAPGLEPEYTIQYELGIKARGQASEAQLSTFYSDIRDMIVRTPTGNTNADGDFEITKANAGDGYLAGVELGGSVEVASDWTLFGNTTYIDGKVDTFPTTSPVSVREPLDRLMPWTTFMGLRWDRPDRRVWVETTGTIAERADRLSTRDINDTDRIPPGGTPGYFAWDLRGGWRINDSTDLTVELENILDEDYRIHGSGVNRPGTNLVLTLRMSF
ncbi:MAG: hemoglobin/transferrin/lactoferrin receptor protein [Chlamydiales bacterium]|jgi:hemoglobin/transferrin/lactoferrin receptor protein